MKLIRSAYHDDAHGVHGGDRASSRDARTHHYSKSHVRRRSGVARELLRSELVDQSIPIHLERTHNVVSPSDDL